MRLANDASTDMSYGARLTRYVCASAGLARLDDRRLAELVDGAQVIGTGIGGVACVLDIDDVPVFVKRIPLTDLERVHRRSTANLFGLPTFCQYGVGSPGFGAWRELAANHLTTNWVLARQTESFPMMYHWRVLPSAPPVFEEHADIDRTVAYWDGSPAVRERLNAVARASASVVLFSEYIGQNLSDWLNTTLPGADDEAAASIRALVQRGLLAGAAFMKANGLLHFDAHFGNILTDGQRLYFADLGLATSPRFELSTEEHNFLTRNATHDEGYAMMRLVNWLVTDVCGVPVPSVGGPVERNDYIRRWAEGARPAGVAAVAAAMITRYAAVATVMNDFYWDLFGESRATPYPAQKISQALASASRLP